MPKLGDCIDKAKGLRSDFPRKELLERAEQLEKDGMTEKQAGRQALSEYHKQLHDDLNEIKKAYKIPTDKYQAFDPTEKVNEINTRYEKAQSEVVLPTEDAGVASSNELIATEESSTTESIIPETTQDTGAQPPIPTEPNKGGVVPPSEPPVKPPKASGESTGGGALVHKMRSFQKNLINRSTKLTPEQKKAILTDTKALYTVLPKAESKKIALETIQEIGVDEAVKLATLKSSQLLPSERTMILGAAMDYYAGKAKEANKKGDIAGEKQAADLEIDANEKMLRIADTLGEMGTEYGRAINLFNDIYKLSNIALSRKLEAKTKSLNDLLSPDADKKAEAVLNIVNDEVSQVKELTEKFAEKEAQMTADHDAAIKTAQQEISDLKKQIEENTGKPKGSKENPLKIKRTTNDTDYDKRLKEFKQRHRSGLNKDDLSDLTYFGLYHIENGVTKFADWYNAMRSKFGKFKDNLRDVYDKAKEDAISNGADEKVFSDNAEIDKHFEGLQTDSDAKKMAQITKREAISTLNKAMENNPDRARVLAPRLAAKRIRQDAAKNLDLPTTQNEQTYLKKLVNVVANKAKEYYKSTNEKVSNVNDWLQFAIANGKKDYKIWENTQEELGRQIDADTKLTDIQKSEVKDFLKDYIDSTFETLLTENQKRKIINEQLMNAGFVKEAKVKGKSVKSVDWERIIGTSKTVKEAKEAITKAVTDLGFTQSEAKNEINALLDLADNIIKEKITRDTNAFLNKSIIDKAKGFFGKGVGKSKIQRLVDLKNKGILDVKEARKVLSDQLGIHEVSAEDYQKIKDLLEIIDLPDLPVYVKKRFEEQVQYIFEKYGGNMMYLKHREFALSNQLSSPANFIQNLSGLNRVPSKAIITAIKTGNPIMVLTILKKEAGKSLDVARSVAFKGDVSRGTAYDDFNMAVGGNPKVRYTEYGENKLLGIPNKYVEIGGKKINLNIFNEGMSATSKVVGRGLEATDTFASNPIAALQIYENLRNEVKALHPEYSRKTLESKVYDLMYGEDLAVEKGKAEVAMKKAGLSPTEYQLNRAASEAVERKINDKLSADFYDTVERMKPDAEKRLKGKGVKDPTPEQITSEVYQVLGRDEPMDIVASGEREAAVLTGKKTIPGITWVILKPIEILQTGLRKSVTKEHSPTGKLITNAGDAATQVIAPFATSIGRWIEFGLELTPYGVAKGIGYHLFSKNVGRLENIKPSEAKRMGTDFILRSIQGTAQTMIGFWLLAAISDEDDEPDELATGIYQDDNYNKEKVDKVGKPKRSINVNGHNIPLDLLGSAGMPYMMYSDYLKRRKDKSFNEKHAEFYTGAAVYMENIIQSYQSISQRYGGLMSAIQSGKTDKAAQTAGTVVGQTAGKFVIPFNRFQNDIAQLWNPKSQQSIDFGTNILQQFSIMRGFDIGKPNFDYRGRQMDVGDMYAMSPDGMVKMFEKSKYGDGIDKFLAEIDFAATDAYRESKEEEGYKYSVINRDGTSRFMTPEEYYDFKFETGKKFNDLLKLNSSAIEKVSIKINGIFDNEKTLDTQRKLTSKLLTYSKEEAIKTIQKNTGVIPDEDALKEKKADIDSQINEQKDEIYLRGIDEDEQ